MKPQPAAERRELLDLRNSRRSMRNDTVIGVWIGLALRSVGAFVLRDTLGTVGRVFFVLGVALALGLFAWVLA